ncbi:DedA family protein [Clostridium weizhouense]|uniref:DedA family protein n=1 Tax=Clostridium weizhouense TaxID=2859781 RepID=A0ABS7APY3_9CLOT|nr:DedA family protein [Clostridium weizhouense]MBW6410724.1 DedA family protein [Clostridium weizhouense]
MNQVIIEYLRIYNVWLLGVLLLIQCIGIPTGGTLLVIASGAFAYAGEFNIFILFIEVWIFLCIGDVIAYMLWNLIGHKILNKYPKLRIYVKPKILKGHKYLEKHGKGAVFYTRFLISPMGPFINAAAGITEYKLSHFAVFAALGELFWACMYLGLGYWFGDSWENIIPIITQISRIFVYIIILIIILYFFIKILKEK